MERVERFFLEKQRKEEAEEARAASQVFSTSKLTSQSNVEPDIQGYAISQESSTSQSS